MSGNAAHDYNYYIYFLDLINDNLGAERIKPVRRVGSLRSFAKAPLGRPPVSWTSALRGVGLEDREERKRGGPKKGREKWREGESERGCRKEERIRKRIPIKIYETFPNPPRIRNDKPAVHPHRYAQNTRKK